MMKEEPLVQLLAQLFLEAREGEVVVEVAAEEIVDVVDKQGPRETVCLFWVLFC